jgi:hypothetical protein
MRRCLILTVLTIASTTSVACPWHALVGQKLDQYPPGDESRWVLVIQHIDRMTGAETSFRGAEGRVALPARYGFDCGVEQVGIATAGQYRLSCMHAGTPSTLDHSCRGPDAHVVAGWDGTDRMGITVVSVLLICLPPEAVPPL